MFTSYDKPALYPDSPGYKKHGTSKAAAEAIASSALPLRQKIVTLLRGGATGTADEIAAMLGVDKLSVRPRCSELMAQRKIIATGARRPNASGKLADVLAFNPEIHE